MYFTSSQRNRKSMAQCYVTAPVVSILSSPSRAAVCISEALYGEAVEILEQHGDWVKVRQCHDGYSGYLESAHLTNPQPEKGDLSSDGAHWVCARSTLLFKAPDFKSPVVHRLSFASKLMLCEHDDSSFSRTTCDHYVWTDHCLPVGQAYPSDPLTLARTHFLGAPYRWGGRSTAGVDCSGLIQQLAAAFAISIPRDSGEQEQHIKQQVKHDDYQPMDLVFWPGHTGILINPTQVLHATAFTLNCLIEPLDAVIKRAGTVSSARRLFDASLLQAS